MPPHPRKRTAERLKRRVGAGAEVPQPSAEWLSRDRTVEEVDLQCLALGAVARGLRAVDSPAHDRLALASIHTDSVPVVAQVEGQIREQELDAEREARRRVALAQIRQYPDPALRLQANAVEEFDDDLRRLVERMRALMVDASGVGLAATQVGVLQRLFVFDVQEEEPLIAVIVNPVITERSDETEVDDEGCLSLQGVVVPVERAVRVHIEGLNE